MFIAGQAATLHTYRHNWSLQAFSQRCNLVAHTTYVMCLHFRHEWRDLQLKVDFERQISVKIFMAILFIYCMTWGNV